MSDRTDPSVDLPGLLRVPGLSRRDHFAAMAMQGFIASGLVESALDRATLKAMPYEAVRQEVADGFAAASVRYAEALLAALEVLP